MSTYQAFTCNLDESIIDRTSGLASETDARAWCKARLVENPNLKWASYRRQLDDAPWTRVKRP